MFLFYLKERNLLNRGLRLDFTEDVTAVCHRMLHAPIARKSVLLHKPTMHVLSFFVYLFFGAESGWEIIKKTPPKREREWI